jgi:hypothetical protein
MAYSQNLSRITRASGPELRDVFSASAEELRNSSASSLVVK